MRNRPVSRFMTAPPVVASPATTADAARALLAEGSLRHLPVVDGDRLVGIVSAADLRNAAAAEPLAQLMVADPATLSPDDSLQDAARRLATGGYHALPVIDAGGQVVGIVTSTDLVALLLTQIPAADGGAAAGPPADLDEALRAAERNVARGVDPDGIAAALLALATRQQLLDDAVRRAEEFLHSGEGAREHGALVKAIERVRGGAARTSLPGGRL